MNFKELGLSDIVLSRLKKIDYVTATPIQELAIPEILKGKDVIGMAQTGTGKTAAYALPIIEKISKMNSSKYIKALILCPTRELAIQIRDSLKDYTFQMPLTSGIVIGGVNQKSQVDVLKRGLDILIATPGRLVDLLNQGKVNLSNINTLVLDEADTMLDMGFIKDIRTIIGRTPKDRQTLLFSATMPKEVRDLSQEFMREPLTIKTKTEEVTADNVRQELYYVDKANKTPLLLKLVDIKEKPTTLIFTRTKHGANHLSEQLEKYGLKTSVIHGNKRQSNRVKALSDFKSGKTRIMIATDIAARGIDINNLNLVVNYDVPEKAELYVHRIGRTARAGKSGVAITLCSSAEISELKSVEKYIKKSIKEVSHDYPMVLKEKREVRNFNRNVSSNNASKDSHRSTHSSEQSRDKRNYKPYSNSNNQQSNGKRDYNSNSRPNKNRSNYSSNNRNNSVHRQAK